MPRLLPDTKKRSIEKLIAKIKAGSDVAKRDLNALLTNELKLELEIERKKQQQLKKIKKPIVLKEYEKLHKQALMLFGRYDSYVVKTKTISNVVTDRKAKKEELAIKTSLAVKKAQVYLVKAIKNKPALIEWLDRDSNLIGKDIGLQYDLLPFVITSRSEDKLIDIKERFGLKTIKEMRLEVLNKALHLAEIEIDDWYRANGFIREEWITDEEKVKNEEKLKRLLENLKKNKGAW
ncbi:MAG: hypothetical protein K9J78_10495 [Polynucleobacter sp.]|nr:hypothetical protein [Polynucleobacter sp.]